MSSTQQRQLEKASVVVSRTIDPELACLDHNVYLIVSSGHLLLE